VSDCPGAATSLSCNTFSWPDWIDDNTRRTGWCRTCSAISTRLQSTKRPCCMGSHRRSIHSTLCAMAHTRSSIRPFSSPAESRSRGSTRISWQENKCRRKRIESKYERCGANRECHRLSSSIHCSQTVLSTKLRLGQRQEQHAYYQTSFRRAHGQDHLQIL